MASIKIGPILKVGIGSMAFPIYEGGAAERQAVGRQPFRPYLLFVASVLVDGLPRKPLKRPVVFMATWEIRFGSQNRFRVYYDVDMGQAIVSILAIGIKRGNQVVIGGEEMQV